jgi:hypothetical protein
MPCRFGLLPHPRSEPCAQPIDLLEVTVTVRWIPLLMAREWHSRRETTMFRSGGERSQVCPRVRPVLGDHRLVGKSLEGLRQRVGRLELHFARLLHTR